LERQNHYLLSNFKPKKVKNKMRMEE